jgi:hypothetical protein
MTDREAAMTLQRIRARLADQLGMTVAEMRRQVAANEHRPGSIGPTGHALRGGRIAKDAR